MKLNNNLNVLITQLTDSIADENFTDVANDIIDEIEGRPNTFDAVESILKLMESNPAINFGQQGPLVHFVETFYKKGYKEKLVESLQRRPIMHTVWMLNRIINGSEGGQERVLIKRVKKYFRNA